MWNEKVTKPFLIIYLSCLFLATFFLTPTLTSFYYYAWGKNLAWSYFDGPPMIAYFFHISNTLFGTTFFSINIVGFFCYTLGAYYIYKLGCLLENQRTGLISALIWMALPTTTESIFIRVLYDAPLNLFTAMSFYYFARYISFKRYTDLYVSALCIGAMILSKYTAAISVLGILVYILLSDQKRLFKNVHFYLASLVLLIMVSPILYWNANHNWESIRYLLNFHSQSQHQTTIIMCLLKLLLDLIVNYSVFLVLAVWSWLQYKNNKSKTHKNNPVLEFNYLLLFSALAFWMVATLLGGVARVIYLTPLGINIALAAGYCIDRYSFNRFFKIFYPIFLVISLVMVVANSWPIATYLKKGLTYSVVSDTLNQQNFTQKDQPIVTGFYTSAAIFSFFMPKETIYALPCEDINQYKYWNASFLQDLANAKIDKITYIGFKNTKACAEQYFDKCQSVATVSHNERIPVINKTTKAVSLYVYECSIPHTNFSGYT